jgi:hypothetical protein
VSTDKLLTAVSEYCNVFTSGSLRTQGVLKPEEEVTTSVTSYDWARRNIPKELKPPSSVNSINSHFILHDEAVAVQKSQNE